MMLRPMLHDRLVARAVLSALLPVWLILLGFDAISAFAAELDELGEGSYSAADALLYTAYTLPRRIYELFPTAAVIGALLGLGGLAATSELTALRSVGLSRARIVASALLLLAAITALMIVVGETAGPAGESRAQALVVAAKSEDMAVARWSGLWAREGETIINARQGFLRGEEPATWVELLDVRVFEFDDAGRLASLAHAGRAEHRDGAWTLFEVERSVFEQRRVLTTSSARERWDSDISPEVLSLGSTRPRYLGAGDLADRIEYMRRNNIDPGAFETAYWGRWFYPVDVLVLCLAALPFAFGTLRSGGFGKRLFLGVVFGVGYFLVQQLSGNLAEVYSIDRRLASAVTPLAVVTASWLYFRRKM